MGQRVDVVVLIGLPASGKTTRTNKEKESDPGIAIFDDFLGVKKQAMGQEGMLEMFRIVRDGGRVLCNNIFLCQEERRLLFESFLKSARHDVVIQWVCYENDPEACKENARRHHSGHEGDPRSEKRLSDRIANIEHLSQHYAFPEGCAMKPVYRPA